MSYRLQKINSVIQQELSELLHSQVKDPRLSQFICVTDVRTSPDIKFAKVFVSFIGTEEEKVKAMSALSGAAGFLRKELARRLRLRSIPELSFHWDDSIERADRVMSLLDKVSEERED
ncbi:MAG: 30S ribosome-binding factor RbfA [Chloroflexi bacterium]|nr:30S ribosome-binding factor RbfA [Chloroflexota bacterium]